MPRDTISHQQFPPLDPGDHVSVDGFVAAYHKFSVQVRHSIFKLERLQAYQEPTNESWHKFVAGNLEDSLRLIPQIRAADAQEDIAFFRRGLHFDRVRAVELPLSPYLKWELEFYKISAQYGETILITDITNADRYGSFWNSRDFLLFDSLAVLVHDYDVDGLLNGGWICRDKSFIDKCSDLAHEFVSASVPLGVFAAVHQSIQEF